MCDHKRMTSQKGEDFCPKCLSFLPKENFKGRSYSKYKNKICQEDGITFHSKAERDYYIKLKLKKDNGLIKYFLRQIPFYLPGKVKYLCDFMVVHLDGSLQYVDVKGYDTQVSKIKRKMVEDLYPIKIEVLKK